MNWKQAKEYATAVVAIVMLTQLVLPRRNTAKLIEAMGQSFSTVIRTTIAIQERDPSVVETVLAMAESDRKEMYEYLTTGDMEWLSEILVNTVD